MGVHVVYGIVGYSKDTLQDGSWSCAAKATMTARYVHIATGNYNGKTARTYEDFGLLTSDPAITDDVGELFNFLTGFADRGSTRRSCVSPLDAHALLIEPIDLQRDRGRRGSDSMKVNGLTDLTIIDALYEASSAGSRSVSKCARPCSPRPACARDCRRTSRCAAWSVSSP